MTFPGWIMMFAVTGTITVMLCWCSWKVMRIADSAEHIHSPLDVDTPDKYEE
jgi:hypothetical protein